MHWKYWIIFQNKSPARSENPFQALVWKHTVIPNSQKKHVQRTSISGNRKLRSGQTLNRKSFFLSLCPKINSRLILKSLFWDSFEKSLGLPQAHSNTPFFHNTPGAVRFYQLATEIRGRVTL